MLVTAIIDAAPEKEGVPSFKSPSGQRLSAVT